MGKVLIIVLAFVAGLLIAVGLTWAAWEVGVRSAVDAAGGHVRGLTFGEAAGVFLLAALVKGPHKTNQE